MFAANGSFASSAYGRVVVVGVRVVVRVGVGAGLVAVGAPGHLGRGRVRVAVPRPGAACPAVWRVATDRARGSASRAVRALRRVREPLRGRASGVDGGGGRREVAGRLALEEEGEGLARAWRGSGTAQCSTSQRPVRGVVRGPPLPAIQSQDGMYWPD